MIVDITAMLDSKMTLEQVAIAKELTVEDINELLAAHPKVKITKCPPGYAYGLNCNDYVVRPTGRGNHAF